jgi:uroporphyrinogen-III synthase
VLKLAVSRVIEFDHPFHGDFSHVVLTSRHAASWFVRHHPQYRGVVAVSGDGTAAILREAGMDCLVPSTLGGAAALEILDVVQGETVLFPCGEKTAGTVEALALARGIDLRRLVVYGLQPVESLRLPPRVDAIGFLSGQMVEMFHQNLAIGAWNDLSRLPVLCLKGTAEAALESLGWLGQVHRMEKIPGQEDLSSLLLEAAALPGSLSSRASEQPGS